MPAWNRWWSCLRKYPSLTRSWKKLQTTLNKYSPFAWNMTQNISNQVYSKKHDAKHFESSVFEELHLLLIKESVEQRIAIIILKYLKDCTIPCQQAFYAFPIGKIVKWTYQWKINFNLTNTFLRKTSKTISYLFSIKIMWPRQASSKHLRNGSWLTTRF